MDLVESSTTHPLHIKISLAWNLDLGATSLV
jgi:hypothetical protein